MKLIIVLLMVMSMWRFVPVHLANEYLQCTEYSYVTVKNGESLWVIAEKYVSNGKDIRELIAAIHQLNELDSNGNLVPGQVLKIPVLASL